MRRTKIVATIGPATEDKSKISDLIDAGMNIARLNCSHGTEEQFKKIVHNIRECAKEKGKIVTILGDLQGPKIRIGNVEDGKLLVLKNDIITFSTKEGEGIHIPFPPLSKILKKGELLLIEDGIIRTKILSINGNKIKAKVISGGYIRSRKGVNLPQSKLPTNQSLTAKDRHDLTMLIKLGVENIALSFVERKEDILNLKKEIEKITSKKINIISKIERPAALKHLQEIIEVSDGIMVARGDLGIETKAERVPIEQKRMIAMAREMGKPVIVATQILQSMVTNPIATRAEISDAANAIFDHADAFMLSNETAVGEYPIRAVRTLARVAKITEEAIFKNREIFLSQSNDKKMDEDEAMAINACSLAEEIKARTIVVLTKNGFTASRILKNRPKVPVFVIGQSPSVAEYINFYWGIEENIITEKNLKVEDVAEFLVSRKLLSKGEEIVIIKLSDKKRSLVQTRT